MRWEAIAGVAGGRASRRSASPDGAPPPPPQPANAAAASAAARALPQRRTRPFVEEVQLRHLDRHRHLVVDREPDVWRELRDEVRPRPDHAALVLLRGGERLVDDYGVALDRPVVDLEVRHRLRSERLDE